MRHLITGMTWAHFFTQMGVYCPGQKEEARFVFADGRRTSIPEITGRNYFISECMRWYAALLDDVCIILERNAVLYVTSRDTIQIVVSGHSSLLSASGFSPDVFQITLFWSFYKVFLQFLYL